MNSTDANSNESIELGLRIKHLRESQGLSKKRFCLMIGMSRNYLIALETGERNPKLGTLKRIADGLGVSIKDLFDY